MGGFRCRYVETSVEVVCVCVSQRASRVLSCSYFFHCLVVSHSIKAQQKLLSPFLVAAYRPPSYLPLLAFVSLVVHLLLLLATSRTLSIIFLSVRGPYSLPSSSSFCPLPAKPPHGKGLPAVSVHLKCKIC